MNAPTTFDGRVVGHTRTGRRPSATATPSPSTAGAPTTRYVNDAVRQAFADGAATVRLDNVNGQRYIGTGLSGEDRRIEVHGTRATPLAYSWTGPPSRWHANAQDGVGNTMNGGGSSSTAARATCWATACAAGAFSSAATSATGSAST